MTKNCAIAALAMVLATTAAQAAPLVHTSPAFKSNDPVMLEHVRCNCGHRIHHRRRFVRVVPDAYVPVYPGPPVGFTFRKLFDAGYF